MLAHEFKQTLHSSCIISAHTYTQAATPKQTARTKRLLTRGVVVACMLHARPHRCWQCCHLRSTVPLQRCRDLNKLTSSVRWRSQNSRRRTCRSTPAWTGQARYRSSRVDTASCRMPRPDTSCRADTPPRSTRRCPPGSSFQARLSRGRCKCWMSDPSSLHSTPGGIFRHTPRSCPPSNCPTCRAGIRLSRATHRGRNDPSCTERLVENANTGIVDTCTRARNINCPSPQPNLINLRLRLT